MQRYHYIISEKCNMNCSYCNVDVDSNVQLSLEYFFEFIKDLKRKNEPYIFDIFGGEVFLFSKKVLTMVKHLEIDELCKVVNITTNATIFNNDVSAVVSSKKVNVTLSYDGLKQTLNRGANKLFLKEYISAGASLGHCMVTGNDFNSVSDSDYLIRLHMSISEHSLLPDIAIVRDIGSWTLKQSNNFISAYEQYVRFCKNDLKNNFNSWPGLIKYSINGILNYHVLNIPQGECGVGKNYLAILPNGIQQPCERFSRDNTQLKDKDKYLEKCFTCDIRNYCNRGCIYEQIKNKGPIDELCAIYKGMYNVNKTIIKDLGIELIKEFEDFTKI